MEILAATCFLPAGQNRARAEYRAAHLPGPGLFDIGATWDHGAGLPHMLPPGKGFAPVAVQDRSASQVCAPRVWFTLQV